MSEMWKIVINENSFDLDEFKNSNLFAFGGDFGNLALKDEEEIGIIINQNDISFELSQDQLFNFVKKIEIEDHVLFTGISEEEYVLGKVTSDYYFDSNSDFGNFYNFRDIEYLGNIKINYLKENNTISSIDQCSNVDKIDLESRNDVLNTFFMNICYDPELFNLEEGLKAILGNYPRLRDLIIKEGYITNESDNLKSFIFNKFPNKTLIPLISTFGLNKEYVSFGSKHQGQLPPLAFLTIKFIEEGYGRGASDFYYIVYLFRGDFNGVYLTLSLASSHLNNFDIDGFKNQIEEECQDELSINEFNPYDINLYCDLVSDYNFSHDASYEDGTLFWKYYDFSDNVHFPNNEDLEKDLRDYMKLYESSLEKCDFESFKLDD